MSTVPHLLYARLSAPPSLNNIYEPAVKRGPEGLIKFIRLKDGARVYQKRARREIAQQWAMTSGNFPRQVPYMLVIRLCMHYGDLFTKTYPKAQNRFQKLDASNHIKIVEDAVSKALGEDGDDRCNFSVQITKVVIPDDQAAFIEVWVIPILLVDASTSNAVLAQQFQRPQDQT